MSGVSVCRDNRGVQYCHNLPEARRRKSSNSRPSRVWVFVRRAVVKAMGFYVGRRIWVVERHVRRVTWVALWAKVRRTVRSTATASHDGAAPSYYDSVSYAQNFDDGRWKEEEEEYWRSGSFAYRFGKSDTFRKLI